MNRFTFNRGTWENDNPLPAWGDDEDSTEYLKRLGYSSRAAFYGDEHGGQLDIHESSKNNSFFAQVCPNGGSVYEVYLPDLPSMMIFIRDYAATFSAESANVSQQQILELLEKLFRVQHGHHASAICAQCDPEGWAQWQRRKDTMNSVPA